MVDFLTAVFDLELPEDEGGSLEDDTLAFLHEHFNRNVARNGPQEIRQRIRSGERLFYDRLDRLDQQLLDAAWARMQARWISSSSSHSSTDPPPKASSGGRRRLLLGATRRCQST